MDKGFTVTDNAKKHMQSALDSWFNPGSYPANHLHDAILTVEQTIQVENGHNISNARNFEELRADLEQVNRVIYYKVEAPRGNGVATPDNLSNIEKEQDMIYEQIYSVAGGIENVKKLEAWGKDNLTKEELDTYIRSFNALYTSWGMINLGLGESLIEATDQNLIKECKNSVLYLESLYNQRN